MSVVLDSVVSPICSHRSDRRMERTHDTLNGAPGSVACGPRHTVSETYGPDSGNSGGSTPEYIT